MNIGINIYTLRKEKKITQAQLAEKLGADEQDIFRLMLHLSANDSSIKAEDKADITEIGFAYIK